MKDFDITEVVDGCANFSVSSRKNENSENLIRRFLRKTKKEKIVEEVLDRKFYKKPTTKKREALFRKRAVLAKIKEKQRLELQLDD